MAPGKLLIQILVQFYQPGYILFEVSENGSLGVLVVARVGNKRAPEMVVAWIEIQAYNIGRAYSTLSSLGNR